MKAKTLKLLLQLPLEPLVKYLVKTLRSNNYTDMQTGLDYLYAPGTLPVLLIAHLDTVFEKTEQTRVLYDQEYKIFWSPDGLGADDRAGVAMILALLNQGYKPHILFTDGEERGCIGAREASTKLKAPKVNALIELDRQGRTDAVYYDLDSAPFEAWVTQFGWEKTTGTLTDISLLAPAWGIAGVNLSIGYYNQHTKSEHLYYEQWMKAKLRVEAMLQNLPKKKMEYVAKPKVLTPYVRQGNVHYIPKAVEYGGYGNYSRNFQAPDDDIPTDAITKKTADWDNNDELYADGYVSDSNLPVSYWVERMLVHENQSVTIAKVPYYEAICDLCEAVSDTLYETQYCFMCSECYEVHEKELNDHVLIAEGDNSGDDTSKPSES